MNSEPLIDVELLRVKLWPDVATRPSQQEISRLARRKLIPSETVGKGTFFNPAAVRAALEKRGMKFAAI